MSSAHNKQSPTAREDEIFNRSQETIKKSAPHLLSVADDAHNVNVTELPKVYPHPSEPFKVARELQSRLFTHNGHNTIAWWENSWWIWNGTHWHLEEDSQSLSIKKPIWEELDSSSRRSNSEDEELKPWKPTSGSIRGLMEPLKIHSKIQGNAPMWVDGAPAQGIISMKNGLFNLKHRTLEPHTPELFTTWSLPFDYLPGADCPTWTAFLAATFDYDPQAIELLQEFAGYLISGRTDLHKALLVIGAKRGGKGTISRTLQALMGQDNTVSPSLSLLGSDFGLSTLIGKPLATIEDARAVGHHRNNAVVERLLSITGEDRVAIDRKGIDHWNGRLPTRFMIVSNEVPRFTDASGAILTRLMMIEVKKTVKEQDRDPELGDKITQELPGVFNWALEGIQRLEQQRCFTRPETMDELHDTMSDLASPVKRFIEEHYVITGGKDCDVVPIGEAHGRFKIWCESEGFRPLTRDEFMRQINAIDREQFDATNTTPPGMKKNRYLRGVKLKDLS